MKSNYETNGLYCCPKCHDGLGFNFGRAKSRADAAGKVFTTCLSCGYKDKEVCFKCRNRDVYCADCVHLN